MVSLLSLLGLLAVEEPHCYHPLSAPCHLAYPKSLYQLLLVVKLSLMLVHPLGEGLFWLILVLLFLGWFVTLKELLILGNDKCTVGVPLCPCLGVTSPCVNDVKERFD